eukprot:SAG31_NODE_917_length_11033_cov_3.285897_7_plen_64_part_00
MWRWIGYINDDLAKAFYPTLSDSAATELTIREIGHIASAVHSVSRGCNALYLPSSKTHMLFVC